MGWDRIQQRAEAILSGRPDRVWLEPPRLEPAERSWIARSARRRARLDHHATPRSLAAALQIQVGCASLPDFDGEVTVGRQIFYRRKTTRAQQGLLILHGIAHVLLDESGLSYSEADAWLLTGDLLLPADIDLPPTPPRGLHAPDWFVTAWLACRLQLQTLEPVLCAA